MTPIRHADWRAPADRLRPVFAGFDGMRPAVGLDGGTVGSWSLRAGWVIGTARRHTGNWGDTFAVWAVGTRLFTAVGAAGRSPDSTGAASLEVRDGVSLLARSAALQPSATAHELLATQQRVLRVHLAADGMDSRPQASFAVGVFSHRVATYGTGHATLAAIGPDVGAWVLGDGGRPRTVLTPGEPAARHTPGPGSVQDGDVVCFATSALTERRDGGQFLPMWSNAPDEPEFLAFLHRTLSGHRDDAALIVLWAGQYEANAT